MLARQYLAPFFWCILFFCSLLGVAMFRHANAEVASTSTGAWRGASDTLKPLPAVLESKLGEEPMIVVSPTGVLHSVNPVTRQTLWTYASGSDMGSVLQITDGNDSRETNPRLDVSTDGENDEQIVYTGPDGKVYVLQGSQVGPTAVNVKDLLANTPRHTEDGAVVLSSVHNTAFLLNKDTGALIRKFEPPGSVLERAASVANGKVQTEDAKSLLEETSGINSDVEKIPTVLCLRTDYSVMVQELSTGAVRWNISLADIKTLSLVQPPGQAGMLGPSEVGGNRATVTSVLGDNRMSSIPSYKAAPIALFSSTGEYLSNLLPATSPALSMSDPGRRRGPLRDSIVAGVPFSMPRGQPGHGNGLIPVLAGVTEDVYPRAGSLGQNPVSNLDNRSAGRAGATLRAGHEIAWGSVGGVLLVITGVLSFVWYLYNRYVLRKQEEVAKPKRAGTGKGRKRGKKGTLVLLSTPNKGLMEDENNEFTKHVKGNVEGAGSWGVAKNKCYGEGIQVGRLFVSKVVIGAGSNGTSVFEGYLDGRHVAVKRLLANHYDRAVKEIQFLITSDEHPNVVRYFAMEETSDFVYVALERCALSLYDLIVSESERSLSKSGSREEGVSDVKCVKMPDGSDVKLWNDNGRCSPHLLLLMRDIVAGLSHLHAVGIVHRDLKPHNVLVSNNRKLQAKLADMGLSKHLANDVSSYQDTGKGGSGSRGWQAPEQLKEGRQTRAVDVFSLGCLLFFCITGGQHPYGEHFLRDANIANGSPDFFYIEDMPEALHLIKALLSHDPSKRPAAKEVLSHPFFWREEDRLQFLLKASDRVEHEDRVLDSEVLPALEAIGPDVFGASWEPKLDAKLLDDGRRYRKYNFSSVRDLLRIIRNKSHHFRELPLDMQESLGSPEGFETYFSARFPRLLMEVYKVMHDHCIDEPTFKRFFEANGAV